MTIEQINEALRRLNEFGAKEVLPHNTIIEVVFEDITPHAAAKVLIEPLVIA